MEVVHDFSGDEPDALLTTLDLDRFSQPSETDVLMYGIRSCTNTQLHERYKDFQRRCLYDVFSPCAMYCRIKPGRLNFIQLVDFFNEVYCTCPYTTNWFNKYHGQKLTYFASAFNPDLIPKPQEKQYDVCYFGSIHSRELLDCANMLPKFKYIFTSKMHGPLNRVCNTVTHQNLNTRAKLNLIAQCKISICYNLLYLRQDQAEEFLSYEHIKDHGAYQGLVNSLHLDRSNLPQFKIRCHESAACKTLMLVKRDPWNVIETMYTPDEDFVYFSNNAELEDMIRFILARWDHGFADIAENAYKKLVKYYLTPRFYECARQGKSNCLS